MTNAKFIFSFLYTVGCCGELKKGHLSLCCVLMPVAVSAKDSDRSDCIVRQKAEEHYVQDPIEGKLSFTFSFTNLCDDVIKFEYIRPSAPGFSINLKVTQGSCRKNINP